MRETLCHVTSKPASRWDRVANCSCEKVNASHITYTFMNPDKELNLAKSTSMNILVKYLHSVRLKWKK